MRKLEKLIIYVTEHQIDDWGKWWLVHLGIDVGWLLAWYLSIKAMMIAGYVAGLNGVCLP